MSVSPPLTAEQLLERHVPRRTISEVRDRPQRAISDVNWRGPVLIVEPDVIGAICVLQGIHHYSTLLGRVGRPERYLPIETDGQQPIKLSGLNHESPLARAAFAKAGSDPTDLLVTRVYHGQHLDDEVSHRVSDGSGG